MTACSMPQANSMEILEKYVNDPDELPPVEVSKCAWWNDEGEDCGTFNTSCGRYFTLNEGNPIDNGMRYCYHCGKPVDYTVPEKSDEHPSQD